MTVATPTPAAAPAPPVKSLFVTRLAEYSLVKAIPRSEWLTQSSLLHSVVSRLDGLACSGLDLAEFTGTKALHYSDPYVKAVHNVVSAKADTTLAFLEKSADTYLPSAPTDPKDGQTSVKQELPKTLVGRVTRLSKNVLGGSWSRLTAVRTTFVSSMAHREKQLLTYSADHLASIQKLTQEKTSAAMGYATFFYNKGYAMVSGAVSHVRQQVGSVHSFADAKEKLTGFTMELYGKYSPYLSNVYQQLRSYAAHYVPILKSKLE